MVNRKTIKQCAGTIGGIWGFLDELDTVEKEERVEYLLQGRWGRSLGIVSSGIGVFYPLITNDGIM